MITGISKNNKKVEYNNITEYWADNPVNTNARGGSQPIDMRLYIYLPTGDIYVYTILDFSKDVSSSAIKINTVVQQGSPQRAIRTGTGFITPGRTISFSIPIYSKNGLMVDENLEQWTQLVLNTSQYKTYIERYYKGEWWRSEIIINEIGSYKFNQVYSIGTISMKCTYIDNYYLKTDKQTVELWRDIKPGRHDTSFDSVTSAPVYPTFLWKGYNPYYDPKNPNESYPFSIRVFSPLGYGIQYKSAVRWKDATIDYDGNFFRVNGEPTLGRGLPPEVYNGKVYISISCSFHTESFELNYSPAVVL